MTIQQSTRAEWRLRPERSYVSGIRFIVWVALKAGRPAARALLYPVSLYFLAFAPDARLASRRFLLRVFQRPAKLSEVFRHFHAFASTILDRVFFLNDQCDAFDVRIHISPEVEALMSGTDGIVLLGAHLGSFEIVRMIGRTRTVRRVNMVMYEENAKKLNTVLAAINPARIQDIIGLGHCDSMLKVEACLERGELVGLLADRSLRGERQVTHDFLGEPAGFPLGPFRIAAMLRRPIVLMFGLYRGRARYDIHFELLTDLTDSPRAARSAMIDEAMARYVARLEHYCRLDPYNWFNFYDFWQ